MMLVGVGGDGGGGGGGGAGGGDGGGDGVVEVMVIRWSRCWWAWMEMSVVEVAEMLVEVMVEVAEVMVEAMVVVNILALSLSSWERFQSFPVSMMFAVVFW